MIRTICILSFTVLLINIAPAQDFDAVERRLGEAVADGELNLEQASRMMRALRDGHAEAGSPRKRVEFAMRQIREAVESGELDEKTARLKMAALEHRMEYAAFGREIRQAVADGKITRAEAAEKMNNVGKKMKMGSLALKIRHAVESGDLTEEEARSKMEALEKEFSGKSPGTKKNIWDAFSNLGVSDESLGGIKVALASHEVDDKQLEPTMVGLMRAVESFQASGNLDADMDENLVKYLEENVGLEVEQIELVERLAKRLAQSLNDR